jgi:DNA-binding response OmpR family regulator
MKPNILIVEDEPRIAALLERGLQSRHFTPAITHNVQQAYHLAIQNNFDLII